MSKINEKILNSPVSEDIILDSDDALKIIRLAEKLGASSAEVYMMKGEETSFSIENDAVNFSASGSELGIGIRVIKDKQLGFGYCTSPDQADKGVKNAINTTKLAKKMDYDFVSMARHQDSPEIFDRSILDLTVEEGLEFAKRLIDSAKEVDKEVLVTGGGVGFGGGWVSILNSSGIEFKYKATAIYCGITTLVKENIVSTGFDYEHSRKNDIKLEELGQIAAELAVKGQNPEAIDPGIYSILFTPHALTELLEYTVIPGLYGEQALRGETVYSNRINEEVAKESVSFIDDGRLENGINTSPIDDEGTPTQRTVLVENGILKRYLFDSLSAFEFDSVSTGNGIRAEGLGGGRSHKAIPKTKATNFTIEGDTKPKDRLISELDNALVIHQLLGAHTANQASGDFSVNSPSLFKIEKGEITTSGKQVMISGNMPLLMKQIIGLADDYKDVSGGLSPTASRLPSVAIEQIRVI